MAKKDGAIFSILVLAITFGLIIFWFIRIYSTDCFNWIDYTASFTMLFINMGLTALNIKEL